MTEPQPDTADAWYERARSLARANRLIESSEACDQVLRLDPGHVQAARLGIHCRIMACDWRRREDDKRRVTAGLKAGENIIGVMDHRTLCDSEEENALVARHRAADYPASESPLWRGESYNHDKIRIAYLSTDFRSHATAFLIAGCFEHHDRTLFETTAISLFPKNDDPQRLRLQAAFGKFIDAHEMSDIQVANLLRDMEIDIAIDLNGYAGRARPGILAHRPAPSQVNYLGYPGTMASPFMDYLIADRIVIPPGLQGCYSEKIVYLPNSYQPNDDTRPIAHPTPSRGEAGLPETGFVFACFNVSRKIGPEVFDVWMRLLHGVAASVLWLIGDSPIAAECLKREAARRSISPDRLIFAKTLPQSDHLARLKLADLFLDTLPCNAHTTASDALWAGLPVLTCTGDTFAGRVAASLLQAIGMPELVTRSLADYEASALALACQPARLAALKQKLLINRRTHPLFDTARFTRGLESAYRTMWKHQTDGLPLKGFAVADE